MKESYFKYVEAKNKLRDFVTHENIPLEKVALSFSGGKDSSLMLRMIEDLGYKNKVKVVFFNTLMEYEATYRFIEKKRNEGWVIDETKPEMPAPLIYKKYGVPFLSKKASEMINRLQRHNFDFINDSNKQYCELIFKYPNCSSALKWLCGENYKINCPKWLRREMSSGVNFKVGNRCCEFLKKKPVKKYNKENDIKLSVIGVRIAEGGARATAYKSCFLKSNEGYKYFPLLWFTDEDVAELISDFNIDLSECYTKYGLSRTGCVGCPFSKDYKKELEILKKYEPNKYIACINLFKNSYNLKSKK